MNRALTTSALFLVVALLAGCAQLPFNYAMQIFPNDATRRPSNSPGEADFLAADGSRYKGSMRNGSLDGWGVITKPDGTTISGVFHENLLYGTVTLRNRDGVSIVALYINGVMQGPATLTAPNGDRYTCMVRDDACPGDIFTYFPPQGGSFAVVLRKSNAGEFVRSPLSEVARPESKPTTATAPSESNPKQTNTPMQSQADVNLKKWSTFSSLFDNGEQ